MARRTRSSEIQSAAAGSNGSNKPTPPNEASESLTPKTSNRGSIGNDNGNGNGISDHPPAPPRTPQISRRRPPFSLPRLRPRQRRREGLPRRERHRLLEDHYRVDKERHVVLPGVPRYEKDWARDMHDFFNLVVLVPVVALNVMNWNWDMLLTVFLRRNHKVVDVSSIADFWTGEWFDVFFAVSAAYFVTDLLWIVFIPSCVRSPATIIQHHVATILYILIPYYFEEFRWCMGACMSVEINTWFLIARRVLNKQGFPPWVLDLSFVSIRVKLISVCFYVTWIAIRCVLYPRLMKPFYNIWIEHSKKVGTDWNLVMLVVPLHASFCLLNFKWSYDLLMSKVRYWRKKGHHRGGGDHGSKGL